MDNIENIELIQINTVNGKLYATLSFQDLNKLTDPNNGYNTVMVPVNIRELQLSVRGNILVDQSIKIDYPPTATVNSN